MGNYLTPGHTYVDGETVTGPSLTEHVGGATFKPTAITSQTLKTPAALTDQLLVVASGAFFQETLQQIHDLILYPGSVVQTQYSQYTANTNLTSVIPSDDTIPQNTEGTEILNLSITPRFVDSTILVICNGMSRVSILTGINMALFRDSTVNAIATINSTSDTSDSRIITLTHMDSPATTSPVSYKIRVGPGSAATVRMNGSTTARFFGGTAKVTLTLQEIKT